MKCQDDGSFFPTMEHQLWAIIPSGFDFVLGYRFRELLALQPFTPNNINREQNVLSLVRDGVAVIPIVGPVVPRANIVSQVLGFTSIEELSLLFRKALMSKDVKSIVLHIDSPGGQITGISEFASQVYLARNIKPVVAYTSGMCASAAYWIASAAKSIIADKTSELGSIGVISTWTDNKEARKSKGLVDYEIVSSQSPNKKLDIASKEDRLRIQQRLDEFADIFISDVARYRGKTEELVIKSFGRGDVLLAEKAVSVGMADKLGSLEEVINNLKSNKIQSNDKGIKNTISKEIFMDKEKFSAEYPELLESIKAEARVEAEREAKEALKVERDSFAAASQALIRAISGDAAAEYFAKLSKAGFTAEQISLLPPLQIQSKNVEEQGYGVSRQEILTAIHSSHSSPINTSVSHSEDEHLNAAIGRISSI